MQGYGRFDSNVVPISMGIGGAGCAVRRPDQRLDWLCLANNFYYGAEFRRDAQFGLGCDDITDSSHESVSGISHRNSCGRSIDHSI